MVILIKLLEENIREKSLCHSARLNLLDKTELLTNTTIRELDFIKKILTVVLQKTLKK